MQKIKIVSKGRLAEAIPTETPVGVLSKLQFAVGAQRGANGWTLFFSSILPNDYTNQIGDEPLCRLLSGAARGEESFGERLYAAGKDTSDVVTEFNLSALQLPETGNKGIVVFSAEVMISVNGDLIGLWVRYDEDFRFIPLPDSTSVAMQGDLHPLISSFCRADEKSLLTHWQWLEQSRPPMRRQPKDWSADRGRPKQLGLTGKIVLRILQSLS